MWSLTLVESVIHIIIIILMESMPSPLGKYGEKLNYGLMGMIESANSKFRNLNLERNSGAFLCNSKPEKRMSTLTYMKRVDHLLLENFQ